MRLEMPIGFYYNGEPIKEYEIIDDALLLPGYADFLLENRDSRGSDRMVWLANAISLFIKDIGGVNLHEHVLSQLKKTKSSYSDPKLHDIMKEICFIDLGSMAVDIQRNLFNTEGHFVTPECWSCKASFVVEHDLDDLERGNLTEVPEYISVDVRTDYAPEVDNYQWKTFKFHIPTLKRALQWKKFFAGRTMIEFWKNMLADTLFEIVSVDGDIVPEDNWKGKGRSIWDNVLNIGAWTDIKTGYMKVFPSVSSQIEDSCPHCGSTNVIELDQTSFFRVRAKEEMTNLTL